MDAGDAALSSALAQLFDSVPSHGNAGDRLQQIHNAFQATLIRRATEQVNRLLAVHQPDSFSEFKGNAGKVNELLSALGLMIEYEGKPALLVGEVATKYLPRAARYSLLVLRDRNHHDHAISFREPVPLHVVPATAHSRQQIEKISRQVSEGIGR